MAAGQWELTTGQGRGEKMANKGLSHPYLQGTKDSASATHKQSAFRLLWTPWETVELEDLARLGQDRVRAVGSSHQLGLCIKL